eukprot:8955490-Karenia_brevis.AAC.1
MAMRCQSEGQESMGLEGGTGVQPQVQTKPGRRRGGEIHPVGLRVMQVMFHRVVQVSLFLTPQL